MPKYWGKQIISLGRFPEVGQKQQTERGERKKKEDRKLVITMASYALQSHLGWRMQAAWANNNGQLCIVNASSGGAHNPPSQKKERLILQGLGVGPGSATERWPSRKIARK